ncbi:MAG: methyltransferase [Sphingobacteriales bacterium]|nr:methyltransferase [Sphingobacteriales bacterium]OJW35524.1 MAG: hypothetical protein BGO54_04235 [Sphingobacteriales bacterium 46-32]
MSSPQAHIIVNGNAYFTGGVTGEAMAGTALFQMDMEAEGLGEITTIKPEITFNTSRTYRNGKKAPDGIEIRFGAAKPVEQVRQVLKDHGFQFSEKQTMWYAVDNARSRQLAEQWANEEVQVDTTRYEKLNFWVRVKNFQEYGNLRGRTEFWVKTEPPKYFYSKSYLERAFSVKELISEGQLYFKRFYNKVIGEEEPSTSSTNKSLEENEAIAAKLDKLADGMTAHIDKLIHSATSKQRPTAKRLRVAASMRQDGYRLLDIQRVLRALANAYRKDDMVQYPLLSVYRNKEQIRLLNLYEKVSKDWDIKNFFSQRKEEFERLGLHSVQDWQQANEQKQKLLDDHLPTMTQRILQENEEKIKELEEKAFLQNIPGFFPTPPDLIERMLDMADLQFNQTILDPSAGKGDILDAVLKRFPGKNPLLFAFEVNDTLRDILHLKTHGLEGDDFLASKPENMTYDRIIMNPPFENGQDIAHVTHALTMLRPGGRVVAVVGNGYISRPFKKDMAFRQLLEKQNAYVSEPIHGAFKKAFNSTGVIVRVIVMNEDGSPVKFPGAPAPSALTPSTEPSTDTNSLEAEAEAELELLKLRVELERKKKRSGLSGIDPDKLEKFRQNARLLNYGTEVLDFN